MIHTSQAVDVQYMVQYMVHTDFLSCTVQYCTVLDPPPSCKLLRCTQSRDAVVPVPPPISSLAKMRMALQLACLVCAALHSRNRNLLLHLSSTGDNTPTLSIASHSLLLPDSDNDNTSLEGPYLTIDKATRC